MAYDIAKANEIALNLRWTILKNRQDKIQGEIEELEREATAAKLTLTKLSEDEMRSLDRSFMRMR
jgi:hypothetical protein